jgi:phosphoribosylaminoimidazolecarboxamide formyltransferase/IMP cyclohydrolase
MRAIISVADRAGLAPLAQELSTHNVELFSSPDTLALLRAEGIVVEALSSLVGVPDLSQGHVDLLHPTVLAGVMTSHHAIPERRTPKFDLIDVVVVNCVPVAELAHVPSISPHELLSQVEIGTMTLLRATACNFSDVLLLVRPEDYAPVMQEWREQGEVSWETRRHLAALAFQYSANYETALAEYLRMLTGEQFPENITLPLERIQTLRYGENPHQQAAFYRWKSLSLSPSFLPSLAYAEVLHGKEPSFNNLLDLDTALQTVQSFTAPTVVIVKHTNPCGLACDDFMLEAYKKAHAGDSISAFGAIIGSNRPIDLAMAQEISQLFYEAIIAPDFHTDALELLRQKKSIRLLATHCPIEPKTITSHLAHPLPSDVRSVSGGLLLQTPDVQNEREIEYRVVTEREPTLDEVTDLMFAWKVVQHVKSNGIVLAHKLMMVGVGAGQMNRLGSVQIAVSRAGERARGSVLASDAFFPFADGIEAAARAGVTAIIQPGGSLRDEEAIRMANHYAIAMIFTGRRHFRH